MRRDRQTEYSKGGITMEKEMIRAGTGEEIMNRLLRLAVSEGASDLHIEPEIDRVRVRLRKDGTLHVCCWMTKALGKSTANRAKVLGNMDMGESRLPQDGSFSARFGDGTYDFRLSVLPSMYGETVVIRVLSGRVDFIEKNRLGMLEIQESLFRKYLQKKSGMILTTGPTGSGKTSTLYAALKLLNEEGLNIISIEDPVEYRIPGITQVQVNERSGLTFSRGLRSFVRQDPDIILVGEIRDRETAEIAVHAALTGHLVLSTLHTGNACEAPLRLVDMGIPSYLLAPALSLIISQRLAGKLCSACKKEEPLTAEEVRLYGLPESCIGRTAARETGCSRCRGKGTAGQIGIFELLPIGREEKQLIHEKAPAAALKECMKKRGQPTLREAALQAMDSRIISPREVSLIDSGGDD